MKQLKRAAMMLASLSVYRGVLKQAVPGAFYRLLWSAGQSEKDFLNAWGNFFAVLSAYGGTEAFSRCIAEAVQSDENPFSLACAAGDASLPPAELDAVCRDLAVLREVSAMTPDQVLEGSDFAVDAAQLGLPHWRTGETPEFLSGGASDCVKRLAQYYRKNGCGPYARYRAFIWRGGWLCPVVHPDRTTLADLKGYELQRGMAIDNTLAFLNGLPANNCLFYGDRGTGKSSTVKALLNEYYTRGLRMIEIPKKSLADFPLVVDRIAGLPMKFIVFIDDLSFAGEDDTYASLKAVLEGGLAVRPDNTLIYATSNRRHLIRENFSDREGDEIHRNDSIQESLSLADRFGLSIRYALPGKDEFLKIVRALSAQRGLHADPEELEKGAEQWALARGGRSPRCAKQYIRSVEARLKAVKADG